MKLLWLLRIGPVSMASLKQLGIMLEDKDLLIMAVGTGSMCPMTCLKSCARRESRLLDLMGEYLIILSGSEVVRVVKVNSLVGGAGLGPKMETELLPRSEKC